MTTLDWIAAGLAALTALAGLRRGLIGTALVLAGLVAGAVIGAREAPQFLSSTEASHYAALVGLGGAIVGASLLQGAAAFVGSFIRGGLRLLPPLRFLDSIGGLVVGAAFGLVLVWVAAAIVVQIPDHAAWKRDVRQSKVVHRLNEVAPPKDVLKLRASIAERFPL
jgi:uncharacterized membrane protein required for colicin V production